MKIVEVEEDEDEDEDEESAEVRHVLQTLVLVYPCSLPLSHVFFLYFQRPGPS